MAEGSHPLGETIRTMRAAGDYGGLCHLLPYAAAVGLSCRLQEDGRLLTLLAVRESNTGNTQIPAVHGGVVGALLEHAAALQLMMETDTTGIPKIINLSVDYLRPCLATRETHAHGTIIKQGRRIANVRVVAWQDDETKPVAAGHAHFLLG